jgi:hypothetical protein
MFFDVVGTGHTPHLPPPPSVSLQNNMAASHPFLFGLSSLCVADEGIDLY